jgi:hypothetical protein
MGTTTTAFANSCKAELPSGYHCFLAQQLPTGTIANGSSTISNMSSVANLAVGMSITNAGIPASAYIDSIPTSGSVTISSAAVASATGTTLTISGDQFAMALIKVSPTGTYGAATTNYTNVTGNADEVVGTGYTAGGFIFAPSTNISPAVATSTAIWSWSVNPSWTSATFSTQAGLIYNTSLVRSGVSGRACSVEDFGGTQTVSNGTFTVVLPANTSGAAILRIA